MTTLAPEAPILSVRLTLPPPTNSGYKLGVRFQRAHGWGARMMKTDRLIGWEQETRYRVGAWEPPYRTPLSVRIVLHLPIGDMRRKDIDGMHKFLIDQTVGNRRDQWVDMLVVEKHATNETEGWADVTVWQHREEQAK